MPNSWLEIFHNVLRNVIQPQLQSNPLGKWIEDDHQLFEYFHDNENRKVITRVCYNEMSNDEKLGYQAVDINESSGKVISHKPNREEPISELGNDNENRLHIHDKKLSGSEIYGELLTLHNLYTKRL